jgi:L-ascorbate metabolism protein UlaG (beta-lactamase superfamily)
MGPDDAIMAAQFVKARRVVPCHYNTFPVIEQDAQAFAAQLQQQAEIEGTVLEPGGELTL